LQNRGAPDIRCGRFRRFSETAPWFAAIAQLVEHVIRNDGVTGSSPVCGTTRQWNYRAPFGSPRSALPADPMIANPCVCCGRLINDGNDSCEHVIAPPGARSQGKTLPASLDIALCPQGDRIEGGRQLRRPLKNKG
jgi:hypothetical protein